jgi:hypothetical protein
VFYPNTYRGNGIPDSITGKLPLGTVLGPGEYRDQDGNIRDAAGNIVRDKFGRPANGPDKSKARCPSKVNLSADEKVKLDKAKPDEDYFVGLIDPNGNVNLFLAGENGITAHDDLVQQGIAQMGRDLGFSAGFDANGNLQISNMSQLNAPLGLGGQLPPDLYNALKSALGAK